MAGVPRVREASWRRQELLKRDNQKGLGRPKAEREQERKDKEDEMTDWGPRAHIRSGRSGAGREGKLMQEPVGHPEGAGANLRSQGGGQPQQLGLRGANLCPHVS